MSYRSFWIFFAICLPINVAGLVRCLHPGVPLWRVRLFGSGMALYLLIGAITLLKQHGGKR